MKSYAKLTMKQSKQGSENLFKRSLMLESNEDVESTPSQTVEEDDDHINIPREEIVTRENLSKQSSNRGLTFTKLAKSLSKTFTSKKKVER